MSIKDSINKGFTIGDITTSKYDSEAMIKVKDYYELDKLEREKLLELAGQIDIELTKRDIETENKFLGINNKITNVEKNIFDIDNRVEEMENNGTGGITEGKLYYDSLNSYSSYMWVFHKFKVSEEELANLDGVLTLDKYNALSGSDKIDVGKVLERVGITDPTDLEAIETELENSNSQVGALITKIYLKSLSILINKEFNFIQTDKLGLSKRIATTKVLEIVLTKLPSNNYDCTHSTIIRSATIPKVNSIYAFKNNPGYDVSPNIVKVVNILTPDGERTNEFGVCVEGDYGNIFEAPYYVGSKELEKLSRGKYHIANNFFANPATLSISKSTTDYGDVSKFSTRTVMITNFHKFLAYEIKVKYSSAIAASIIVADNIPPFYFPYYISGVATAVDFNFYGSDGSITKGQLIGSTTSAQLCKIVHYGNLVSGVTYSASFQVKGAFQ